MAPRQDVIAQSITFSILHTDERKPSIFARVPAFFYAYWLNLQCVREDLFQALRGIWQIDEESYRSSFRAEEAGGDGTQEHALNAMGDMGYSGSTFFVTQNGAYMVKSVPRHFEHSFFKRDLLLPYADYMRQEPNSLLVRITDFLENAHYSIGSLLGLAPSHHIVMENIKRGESEDKRDGKAAEWETFDLKPLSFFYPERDIADGLLATQAAKSKLPDDFDDKVHLSLDEAEEFKYQLQKDTAFLSKHNAVDYSLLLLRIPVPSSSDSTASETGNSAGSSTPAPYNPPRPQNWRTGVRSADGKFVYRAVILDFFWAKHKVHAMAMTGLIQSYNLIDRQGPMSVTAKSPEYRERFLKMCADLLQVQQE